MLINYVEIARDFIFDEQAHALEMKRLTRRHFVQPRHGKKVHRVFDNENYDTGRRQRGRVYLVYDDKPSKVTGEINCFHIEAKVSGVAACRRIGIDHPKDLLRFDYNAFWSRHFILFDVDRERTGRRLNNKASNTRRKTAATTKTGGTEYNADKATGNLVCKVHGMDADGSFSMQRLVDQMGMKSLCVVRIGTFGKDAVYPQVSVTSDFVAHYITRVGP